MRTIMAGRGKYVLTHREITQPNFACFHSSPMLLYYKEIINLEKEYAILYDTIVYFLLTNITNN